MKLLELHIDGFGKFHDRTISFHNGINVIYGKNEAGKSTLHTFIRGMLFGIERGRGRAAKNDTYSKFEPWENSGTYEGWLRLEKDGTVYRIERRFRKDDKSLRVINETKGVEEEPTKAFMEQLLGGLNETAYNNTISIGQLKSATEESMVGELKNYIANMNTTGNMALNITKATSFLRSQKRTLEAGLVPDASVEYTALLAEIRSVDAEISSPEFENQLASYQSMRTQVRGVIETTQAEKDALNDKISRGRQVLETAGFDGLPAVNACISECDGLYQNYQAASAECAKKYRVVLSVLALLLAAAGIGASLLFSLSSAFYVPLPYSVFPAVFGVLAAAVSAVLFLKGRKQKKKFEDCRGKLGACLKTHLGDDSISKEALDAFHGRMAEYSRLCMMVAQAEETVKKYMEDINSLQEKQNGFSEMIEKQQRTQWELEKKLEHLNNCKNRARALKRVLAENDRIREELAAIDLAIETMTDLSSSIRDSFGLYLNKEASQLVSGITGGIYNSMSIDENLGVFLNTKTKLVPIENVSSGTMDQVYLALRLAAAKLLQEDGGQMPLIFDDSFTQYDDDRLKTALYWLSKAYGGQMIFFTCHKREAQMLRAGQIPFHLVEI